MPNSKKKINDTIDFVTAGDSELSELSDDDNNNYIELPQIVLASTAEVSCDEENEDENDVPLANLNNNTNASNKSNIKNAKRVYRW